MSSVNLVAAVCKSPLFKPERSLKASLAKGFTTYFFGEKAWFVFIWACAIFLASFASLWSLMNTYRVSGLIKSLALCRVKAFLHALWIVSLLMMVASSTTRWS